MAESPTGNNPLLIEGMTRRGPFGPGRFRSSPAGTTPYLPVDNQFTPRSTSRLGVAAMVLAIGGDAGPPLRSPALADQQVQGRAPAARVFVAIDLVASPIAPSLSEALPNELPPRPNAAAPRRSDLSILPTTIAALALFDQQLRPVAAGSRFPAEGWQLVPLQPIATSLGDDGVLIRRPPPPSRQVDLSTSSSAAARALEDLMTPRQARVPARLAQDAAYPPATTALAEFLPDERLRALVPSAARLPNDEAFLGTLRPSPFDDFVFPRRQISNRLVDGWCSIPITPLATWFQESPPRSTQPRGRPEFEPWGLFPLAQLSTVSDAFFQRSASTRQQRACEDSTLPPFLRGALDDVPTRAAKLAGQRLVDGWWSVPITALATWFQESPPRSTQPRGKPELDPWRLFPLAQLSTVSDAFAPRPASPRQQKPFEDSTLSPFLRGVLDDVLARAARLNSQRLLDGWWLQAATTQVTSTVDNGLLVPRQQSSARTFVEPALANLLTGSLCNQLVVPTRPQSRQQLEGWHFQALTAL